MNHKIQGSVLAVFLVLSMPIYAQAQEQGVNDRVNRMTKELNLTQAQADTIKPIIKDYMSKREAVLQEAEGAAIVDHAKVKGVMMSLKQIEYQKLGQVLSKDQMQRWIQKENLRAALNRGGTESQVEDDTSLTANGASFKF